MQGDRSGLAGVAVLMRYTLRLLTLQQFQRGGADVRAARSRRSDPAKWGDEPFRIGLWVGRNSTPNSTEDAAGGGAQSARQQILHGQYAASATYCPWCGAEINPGKHIDVETPGQGAVAPSSIAAIPMDAANSARNRRPARVCLW